MSPKFLMSLDVAQDPPRNRYKFKSVAKRIKEIKVDHTFRDKRTNEIPKSGEDGSFFYDELLNSLFQCFDPDFARFANSVLTYSKSLALLIFNKQKIATEINEYLKLGYEFVVASHKEIFRLISMFSRDLQSDFYEYFPEIFINMIKLFDHGSSMNNPDFLDTFFNCINYLFNECIKGILADLPNFINIYVFNTFLQNKFVRSFSSKLLASLIRQLPNKDIVIEQVFMMASKLYEEKSCVEIELEGYDKSYAERIIECMGETLYYTIKNLLGSLRSFSSDVFRWCLSNPVQISNDVVIHVIMRVIDHVDPGKHIDFLEAMLKSISNDNLSPSFKMSVLIKWMGKNQGILLYKETGNRDIEYDYTEHLIKIMDSCYKECDIALLSEFLTLLEYMNISPDNKESIGNAVLRTIMNYHIKTLETSRMIIFYSSDLIVKFFVDNIESFDSSILDEFACYFSILKPNCNELPEKMFSSILALFESFRKSAFSISEHVYNTDIYNKIGAMNDLTLDEKKVYYKLMREFQGDRLAESFIYKEIDDMFNIFNGVINDYSCLTLINSMFEDVMIIQPDWFMKNKKIQHKLFTAIDFNTSNLDFHKLASKILQYFDDTRIPVHQLQNIDLMLRVCEMVFNAEHTMQAYKEGENAISRLSENISLIQNTDKLLNIAFGFIYQNYLVFRTNASDLIGSIIRFKPQLYGPQISQYIVENITNKALPIKDVINSLFAGNYIEESLLDLLEKYGCYDIDIEIDDNGEEKVKHDIHLPSSDILVLLINSLLSIKKEDAFLDKFDKVTMHLLKSRNKSIREAACNVQYNFHILKLGRLDDQLKQTARNYLNAFVDPNKSADYLVTFDDFLTKVDPILARHIVNLVVNLACGVYHEFMTDKVRKKHKFQHLAYQMIVALSKLDTVDVKPFVESLFPKNRTVESLRMFPKIIAPVIERIHHHLEDYHGLIQELLMESAKSCELSSEKNMKAVVKACSIFLKSTYNVEEFACEILKSCEVFSKKGVDTILRFLDIAAMKFPELFSEREELLNALIRSCNLIKNNTHEIVNVLGYVAVYIPDHLKLKLFEHMEDGIGQKALAKRKTYIDAIMVVIGNLRDSNYTSVQFRMFMIHFLSVSQIIECVKCMKGVMFEIDEFQVLCKLIGKKLESEFRKEFVLLIAESLGDLSQSFIDLNNSDLSLKTSVYNSLTTVGQFAYTFAMQAFADMQVPLYSLQNSASVFLVKIMRENQSIISEFVIPTIKYHINKKEMKIPVSEIILFYYEITAITSELPTVKNICDNIKCFRDLGTLDLGVRESALNEFGSKIGTLENLSPEEVSTFILPLLCHLADSKGIVEALSPVCKISTDDSIRRLLSKLIISINKKVPHSINLLHSLCRTGAFKPDLATEKLLNEIFAKKVDKKIQLQLITAVLIISPSNSVISRLIGLVCKNIVSKKQEVRTIGQRAFTELSKVAPKEMYLEVFQSMRFFLREGFAIPLLYLSLENFVSNSVHVGGFDPFINVITECVLLDIFGQESQIRMQMKKSHPEAYRCHSFDTLKHLAEKIEFKNSAKVFIDTINNEFFKLKNDIQVRGAKKIIENVSEGFSENLTVEADVLINIVKDLLTTSRQEKAKENSKSTKVNNIPNYGEVLRDEYTYTHTRPKAENAFENVLNVSKNFLMSLFSVKLLVIFFDKDLFDIDSEDQVKMLDSFLSDLWDYTISSRDVDTMTVCFKIFEYCVKFGVFPTVSELLDESKAKPTDMLTFIATQLGSIPNALDSFGQRVFSLLNVILTNIDNIKLPTKFTRALVHFCINQVDVYESCKMIFDVLLMVMTKRTDIPEIYDAADKISPYIVTSGSKVVRECAAEFYSQYLSTYKFKDADFKHQIQQMVANLKVSSAQSRESVALFFEILIGKLPEDKLDHFAEFIFLHLGTRLANEDSDHVIKVVKAAISKLLLTISDVRFNVLWELMTRIAQTGDKKSAVGILLIAITVQETPQIFSNALPVLEELFNQRFETDHKKVRQASIQLHMALVNSYESVTLLTKEQILKLLQEVESYTIACKLLSYYLTKQSSFAPNEDDILVYCDHLSRIFGERKGILSECNTDLILFMQRLSDENQVKVFDMITKNSDLDYELTVLSICDIICQVLSTYSQHIPQKFSFNAIKFIVRRIKHRERPVRQRCKLVFNKLSHINTLYKEIRVDVEDEISQKRKERLERDKIEKETDIEAYRQRKKRERELQKIKKRKRAFLNSTSDFLHPYDRNGLPVAYESKFDEIDQFLKQRDRETGINEEEEENYDDTEDT